jgi:hypothetical protein
MRNLFLYKVPTITYLSWDCKNSRNDKWSQSWAHDRIGHSGLLYTGSALGMLLIASQSILKICHLPGCDTILLDAELFWRNVLPPFSRSTVPSYTFSDF